MDSTTAGDGGYMTQLTLGSPWSSAAALPGLTEIERLYNSATGDHATVDYGSSLPGYGLDGLFGRYGYKRYGNNSSIFLSYSGGGVTEQSDYIAGGATATWTWDGVQFINTHDYGRYMQSDLFFYDNAGNLRAAGTAVGMDETYPRDVHPEFVSG